MSANEISSLDIKSGRFSRMLSTACDKPDYDKIITELAGCVVAPTLGSVIPNWMLLVPRHRHNNFNLWIRQSGQPAYEVVAELGIKLGVSKERMIWFEHGAVDEGSQIGCGVDHAHIHVLVDPPFSYDDFQSAVVEFNFLKWKSIAASNAYENISPDHSYLVMASENEAHICLDAQAAGPQFFRKIIARLVGQSQNWNYKTAPYLEHAAITLKNFKGLSLDVEQRSKQL